MSSDEQPTLQTDNDTTAANNETLDDRSSDMPALSHSFTPGDHVMRWEMTPILWPIQVHGIVLSTTDHSVEICDFGLTAKPPEAEDPVGSSEGAVAIEEEVISTPDLSPWNKDEAPTTVKDEKLAEKKIAEKQRITLRDITSEEELKSWKKVNYGASIFGLGGGGGDDDTENKSVSNKESTATPDPSESGLSPSKVDPTQAGPSWQKFKSRMQRSVQGLGIRRSKSTETMEVDQLEIAASSSAPLDHESNSSLSTDPPDFSDRTMNPAMSKLLKKTQKKTASKKNNVLPKSDPRKLVLARTHYLLKHGESVLPPYHVFQSNSECMAVFCKTGYWSTLQASVFLHSTAIGNAKSATAVTIGVAASVPLLAPAIAGIGLAMVGAPWLILSRSKGKWEETTLKLTESFWEQAENDVFVECVEQWCKLNESDPGPIVEAMLVPPIAANDELVDQKVDASDGAEICATVQTDSVLEATDAGVSDPSLQQKEEEEKTSCSVETGNETELPKRSVEHTDEQPGARTEIESSTSTVVLDLKHATFSPESTIPNVDSTTTSTAGAPEIEAS